MESILPILIFMVIILFRITVQQSGGKRKVTAPPVPTDIPTEEDVPPACAGTVVTDRAETIVTDFPETVVTDYPETAVTDRPDVPFRRQPFRQTANAAPEPAPSPAADTPAATDRIRMDSPQTARQAFIYSEIFRRKY